MTKTTIAERALLHISSTAFTNEGYIPADYTCEGEGKNPPVSISHIPKETKSLALIMDDPDAPGSVFDHWVMWNIPPRSTINEGSTPGVVGKNSRGENRYTGPCPPSGVHRYFFKVYALDAMLDIDAGADKRTVEQALENHILAYGELVGLYKKQKG